jgi:hypothetical protein
MHECRHIYKAKANLLWNYTWDITLALYIYYAIQENFRE